MNWETLQNQYISKTNESIAPFLWIKGESHQRIEEELQKIKESNINAVCVESRPHPDFLGEGWWRDMDFIIYSAKKCNMKVWLLDDAHFPTGYANGLIAQKYPERRKKYINYNMVDVWGKSAEVTLNLSHMLKPLRGWSQRVTSDITLQEKNNRLVSVVAYPLIEEDKVDETKGIDLTSQCNENTLTYCFPQGDWRVFVTYECIANKANGGNPDYINIIDAESVKTLIEAVYEPHYQHYKEEFGTTFMGFFSDEPGYGNTSGYEKDERIGHKDMPLPWCSELEKLLDEEYEKEWKMYLPFLWSSTYQNTKTVLFRKVYMELITKLYEKNFSRQLGKWCEERNVEYIGHVIEDSGMHSRLGCGCGHYFRAMAGQHMAGIDTIGCQIIMGGANYKRSNISRSDGEFFHYCLAKLGASSAALDPIKKGRTMCELYGAYGWELGIRDMKWILDFLLINGINFLVPHAFSMSDYPDVDCPPHFYGRGNNPLFPYFGKLMNYARQMCGLLSEGKPVIQVGILYHAESEWMGEYMSIEKVAKVLTQNQIEFLFVSMDMLEQDASAREDGFIINQLEFSYLIVPYCEFVTDKLIDFAEKVGREKVIFVEDYPLKVLSNNTIIAHEFDENYVKSSLSNLAITLRDLDAYEIKMDGNCLDLKYYHYKKRDTDIFFFHNESSHKTISKKVSIRGQKTYFVCDVLNQKTYLLDSFQDGDFTTFMLDLPVYGSLLLISGRKDEPIETYLPQQQRYESLSKELDISQDWNLTYGRAIEYPQLTKKTRMDALVPFSRIEPDFSGVIRYEKVIPIKGFSKGYLFIEHAHEAVKIIINDECIANQLTPPFLIPLKNVIENKTNKLVIEVSTTLEREQSKFSDLFLAKMFEPQNPTGMFGNVIIKYEE
ncbi:glycoside hydrolase family 2 [Candidatus Galacturonibacter soehngenii]|uniref:Glycoside hydrolase family 2 n=1 Tax=Candidatus Galacturonatibacter soehngenii TaxID=2307010 RepID=A0A7V7QKR4_9FIRM|nr:glycoside hydrolase family 2 [Candidatus Galacturonibacter soehngenii]KAB1438449.1 glycoside hydrolase family 2 [Candidatus Galacturonibacter soehngenii]